MTKDPIYLEELFIITPFKEKNNNSLKKTINSLVDGNLYIKFNHIIVYDKSSKNLILSLKKQINKITKFYNVKYLKTEKKGIYSAINNALEIIPYKSFYMILGAGDLIKDIKSPILIKSKNQEIIIFPYKLSDDISNKYITKLRNFKLGMPYCHNAIAFRNDSNRYNNYYSISGDYDYFLRYVISKNLKNNIICETIQNSFFVEFESLSGVSSKSNFKKHLQNILIVSNIIGIRGFFYYIYFKLIKIIKIF